MISYRKISYFMIVTFLVSTFLIFLKLRFSNYLPIIYGLMFYPFLIFRMMNVLFESSSYVRQNHLKFYEKHKTLTSSLDGKIVNLFSASTTELEILNDPKVLMFKDDLKKVRRLLLICFFCLFLLALLVVCCS